MGAFQRLSGQSAQTLRAWERRHGLLQPTRSEGGHRLYTEDDLKVIRRVVALMDSGHAIGAIGQMGRDALLAPTQKGTGLETNNLAPSPATNRWVAPLVDAAQRIDPVAIRQLLDDVFAHLTALEAAERVLLPALYEIGRQWHQGTVSVAGEHLVTTELEFRLRKMIDTSLSAARAERPVLCASPPGERHEIGLLMVSLHLAAASVPVTYLGNSLPLREMRRAAEALRSRAVCLSITQSQTMDSIREELLHFAQEMPAPV